MDRELDSLKTASKKGVHIAGEFLGNKIVIIKIISQTIIKL